MLRQRDEAQGSEAAAVVRLNLVHVVGRPLAADAAGSLRPAEPVLLRIEDGRVASCTPLAGLHAGRGVPGETLGDPDALLLPALSDSHVHLVACAAEREAVDVATPRPASVAEILARLASAARGRPADAWLRATGYDEAWLAERRHPTLAQLDAAVPHRPLRVRHATRHASLLNSAARARLERALGGLDDARAPRDAAGERLGVVHGLEPEITRVVGPLDEDAITRGLRAVGDELARHGVVAVDEVTASNDATRVALLAGAVASGALPQRVRVYVRDADDVEPARVAAAGRVEVAGVKLLARSSEEARTPEFRSAVARARRRGVPVAVHAVEADVV
ncbi:MAG: amidohydrolase family protein, partial [Thermodesulfobacteriota bacterium]